MKIQGVCPSCESHDTLEVDGAGVIRCCWVGCKKPTATWDLLNDPQEHDHVVEFREQGFAMSHPLHERVNEDIMKCDLQSYLAAFGYPLHEPGFYLARRGSLDSWVFVPRP